MSTFGPWQDGEIITLHHDSDGLWTVVDGADTDIRHPPISQAPVDLVDSPTDVGGHEFVGAARVFSTSAPVDMRVQAASDIGWVWGWSHDDASINWNGSSAVPVDSYTADPPADDTGVDRRVGYDYSYDPESPGVSDFARWRHRFVADYYVYQSAFTSRIAPLTPPAGATGVDWDSGPTTPPTFLDGSYVDGYTSALFSGVGNPPSMFVTQYTDPAELAYWPIGAWADIAGLTSNTRISGPIAPGSGGSTALSAEWLNRMWFDGLEPVPLLSFGWWSEQLLLDPGSAPHAGDTALDAYDVVSHADFYITFQGQPYRWIFEPGLPPFQRLFPRDDYVGPGRVLFPQSEQSTNRIAVGTYI